MIKRKHIDLLRSFFKGELVLDHKMAALSRDRIFEVQVMTNYIRTNTLELVANEIKENDVKGAVAELGVYKGEFAKYINKAFPDRRFYLFDTFEGFDKKDVNFDINNDYSTGTQDFSNTSIEEVLSKMAFRENCVVKKGWFPESLNGLDEEFCFVSLDADLYKPILEGLEYFFPRLSKGGYIFVHDYNNSRYNGAKQAVKEFCSKYLVPIVPMSDPWGSAIIAK